MKLFRVNAGVPLFEAVEHAAHLLEFAEMPSVEAAMDPRAEKFTFTAHYLCEMARAILNDLLLAIQPGGPHPQSVVRARCITSGA